MYAILLLLFLSVAGAQAACTPNVNVTSPTSHLCASRYEYSDVCTTSGRVYTAAYKTAADCSGGRLQPVYVTTSFSGQCDAFNRQRTCVAGATRQPDLVLPNAVSRVVYPTNAQCVSNLIQNSVTQSFAAGTCVRDDPSESQSDKSRTVTCLAGGVALVQQFDGFACAGYSILNTTFSSGVCKDGVRILCPSDQLSAASSLGASMLVVLSLVCLLLL